MGRKLRRIYRVVLQIRFLLWYFPPGKPSPTGQSATRRMEKMEVVCISNPRDYSKETPFPEECRTDVCSLRYPPQVRTVESDGRQDCCCEEKGGNYRPWVRVVRPICRIQIVSPRDRALLVIAVPFGI
jgi:hypothetical protein